jgi:hypothetical protein
MAELPGQISYLIPIHCKRLQADYSVDGVRYDMIAASSEGDLPNIEADEQRSKHEVATKWQRDVTPNSTAT